MFHMRVKRWRIIVVEGKLEMRNQQDERVDEVARLSSIHLVYDFA